MLDLVEAFHFHAHTNMYLEQNPQILLPNISCGCAEYICSYNLESSELNTLQGFFCTLGSGEDFLSISLIFLLC